MTLDIFANRRLRQRVKAEALPLTIGLYRRKFLLTENRDDPLQGTTDVGSDKFYVHQPSCVGREAYAMRY